MTKYFSEFQVDDLFVKLSAMEGGDMNGKAALERLGLYAPLANMYRDFLALKTHPRSTDASWSEKAAEHLVSVNKILVTLQGEEKRAAEKLCAKLVKLVLWELRKEMPRRLKAIKEGLEKAAFIQSYDTEALFRLLNIHALTNGNPKEKLPVACQLTWNAGVNDTTLEELDRLLYQKGWLKQLGSFCFFFKGNLKKKILWAGSKKSHLVLLMHRLREERKIGAAAGSRAFWPVVAERVFFGNEKLSAKQMSDLIHYAKKKNGKSYSAINIEIDELMKEIP